MRKLGLAAALAASVAVTGCATYPNQYGYDPYGHTATTTAITTTAINGYTAGPARSRPAPAVGAVGGAIAGEVIPGVSTGQGAIAGAVLGGVLGATINGQQYYRDTRGYCYYVDQYGQPHYNYNTRC